MSSEQCPIQVEYRNFDNVSILYIAFIVFSIAYALAINRVNSPSCYLNRTGIGFHAYLQFAV